MLTQITLNWIFEAYTVPKLSLKLSNVSVV